MLLFKRYGTGLREPGAVLVFFIPASTCRVTEASLRALSNRNMPGDGYAFHSVR